MIIFRYHTTKRQRKGQAIVEYMGFLCLVIVAMTCFFMRDYFRNAIMGRMRQDMGRTFGIEQHQSASIRPPLNRKVEHTITANPFGSW